MRLSQLVSTTPLPSGSSIRTAPEAVAPAAIALKGLADVGTEVAGIAGREAAIQDRADAELKKAQQVFEVQRIVRESVDQLDQWEQTAQHGTLNPEGTELELPPLAPEKYMPSWMATRDTLTEKALARATDPKMRYVLQSRLEAVLGERQHAARGYSNKVQTERLETDLIDSMRDYAGRAVREPNARTPDGSPLWETFGETALVEARGRVPEARLRAIRDDFRGDIATGQMQALAQADPQAAIEQLRTGKTKLPQDKADALADRLTTQWDHRVRQADADQVKFETSMDKWWREQQQQTVSDSVLKAQRGEFTLGQLEETARDWRLHREDISAIRAEIERPNKPVKDVSDSATLDRVIADTHSQFPKMTERTLLDLRTQGLLSVTDYKGALDRLRETREGLIREGKSDAERQQNQGRSIALNRHGQAEQELRSALGIPTLFDKLDPAKEKAWAAALKELRGRSNAYDGKEDPIRVGEDIAPRYAKMLGQDAQMSEDQIRKVLLYPTPAALEAAKTTLPPATYRQQQELFRQLTEAVATRRRLLEESANKPAGSMGRK